jgi:hypothetical protein
VKRIVLDRIPQRRNPQLPPYTEIDHPLIRQAAAEWDGARTTLESSRREVVELEQTREAAEWKDAEAAEQARAEGKAEPKRTHIAAHEKKLDQARHEAKVAELAEDRAFTTLQSALDEHTAAWAQSIEVDVQELNEEWQAALAALSALHARRSRALSIRSMVVGPTPGAGAVPFTPAQLLNVELASGQARETAYVHTGDVLASLAALGTPEPLAEPSPQQHRPPMRVGRAHAEA